MLEFERLEPLGNAIIARKIEDNQQGAFTRPDNPNAESPAQLCEIVALPAINAEVLKPVDSVIFALLEVGMHVYVRFRGYILEQDNAGNELYACAIEDVLAIRKKEVVQ